MSLAWSSAGGATSSSRSEAGAPPRGEGSGPALVSSRRASEQQNPRLPPCSDPCALARSLTLLREVCTSGTCAVTWRHVAPAEDEFPDHVQVTSTPMVADLDGDCVPEIVFNTYAGNSFTRDGVLRAIRGDDGSKVWSMGDLAYRTDSTASHRRCRRRRPPRGLNRRAGALHPQDRGRRLAGLGLGDLPRAEQQRLGGPR